MNEVVIAALHLDLLKLHQPIITHTFLFVCFSC